MKKSALTFLFFAALVAGTSLAHASSITYTFTSGPSDLDEGTSFTYVSTAGFLAFDTGKLAPTTTSDFILLGHNYGPLAGFDFISATEIKLFGLGASLDSSFGLPYQISALTSGESLQSVGTLTITNTAAVTPEPSSLVLLGTGLLGAIGAVRRRLRQA